MPCVMTHTHTHVSTHAWVSLCTHMLACMLWCSVMLRPCMVHPTKQACLRLAHITGHKHAHNAGSVNYPKHTHTIGYSLVLEWPDSHVDSPIILVDTPLCDLPQDVRLNVLMHCAGPLDTHTHTCISHRAAIARRQQRLTVLKARSARAALL